MRTAHEVRAISCWRVYKNTRRGPQGTWHKVSSRTGLDMGVQMLPSKAETARITALVLAVPRAAKVGTVAITRNRVFSGSIGAPIT